ncbi:CRISPR-associated endoribonuclease Cas2 (modular protein) [Kyrpidia spormannii]|uniref:CRISPR-associated endoribonuclease Cas2 (Modular protein) n=1 Tax=Kyrpidia spormannii TaxID=2055160 RepID=A0ACA8ZCB3_9BACL|nr:CRISPR-associated endoribonuclease Cas2 (modular protein) [Kyrpidia spormannii]
MDRFGGVRAGRGQRSCEPSLPARVAYGQQVRRGEGSAVFVILVYDVAQKRVAKVLKKCREYLTWVQNSVLEGEITKANLYRLKRELREIIREDEDSVIIYILRTTTYSERQIMGVEKGKFDQIL